MRIFGLCIVTISYILIFITLILYLVLYCMKKYRAAVIFEKIVFLASVFSCAIESWALVLMNKGFDFNMDADLEVDYSYGLLLIVPAFILLIVLSRLINKFKNSNNLYFKIGDYLLPVVTSIAVAFSTFVLFFAYGYYDYLVEIDKLII
ncbi:MAG: hypothetical protein K6E20_00495 [Acholeplasmatales bacterium]|nr:hypothetical protein [Acholeplasmatales bacterium]